MGGVWSRLPRNRRPGSRSWACVAAALSGVTNTNATAGLPLSLGPAVSSFASLVGNLGHPVSGCKVHTIERQQESVKLRKAKA